MKHGAFSDFVPNRSELTYFCEKMKLIWTVLNIFKKKLPEVLRCYFSTLCQFELCTSLLFNAVSPLLPAVSHV